jgi:hypothetical protein
MLLKQIKSSVLKNSKKLLKVYNIWFKFLTMLAQKFKSSSETTELSETQSLQAVKSMLQVSLQEIAWSRSFLPKSMFIEKKMAGFADVKIHQLHSSDSKDAKMFESWMHNISDLLRSNRLSSIIFGVHDDANDPDDFSEMFHFHIEDIGNFPSIESVSSCRGFSSSIKCLSASKEDVRNSATSMIRSLETLLGTLPAPSSAQKFMSIKLIARDGSFSAQDFSQDSGFSCSMFRPCFFASIRSLISQLQPNLSTQFHHIYLLTKNFLSTCFRNCHRQHCCCLW